MPRSPSFSRGPVLLYFFVVLLLGAMVLGPLLFFALQFIFPVPFHRVMDRALLFSALAALALAWPRIELRSWWPLDDRAWKHALLGLAIALVSTQLILGAEMAMVGLQWASITARDEGRIILTALAAALLVPLAEETIFRGFIQTQLVRGFGVRAGWLLAGLIFMLAHFIKIPVDLDHAPVHLWSGVTAVGAAFRPVVHGQFLSGRGLNLLLIGLLLGGAFLRSGMLWVNYGLHGGWILALLLTSGLTRQITTNSFWSGDLLSSPLTSVVLVLLGFWLWLFFLRPSSEPEPGANAP
jgi:membrane protease YdiL (CAAX protease family)